MEREAQQQREMEVGEFLRAHRLRAGLTLSEASDDLCIRQAYLKAIEDGRFGDLPGPTYVTGFIRTYSEHLGLNGNEVVRQLKAEPLSMDGGSELRFPSPMSEGGMPSGALLLLGVFVALVAYGAWYVSTSQEESIAELISPLPERLVAFLRDENGVAGTEGALQRQDAPEAPRSQPAANNQASPPLSRGQGQIARSPVNAPAEAPASSTADTRDQGNTASRTEPESSPVAVTSSRQEQGDASVAGAADSETAIRENLRIGSNSANTEARDSIDTPQAPGDAGEQSARQPLPESEAPRTADARIILRAKGENWVEIRERDTDRLIVARLFKPGDTFDVPNTPGLKLLTGNAGGLEILVDGEPVPPLGAEGMVRRNIPLDAEQLRSGALARN